MVNILCENERTTNLLSLWCETISNFSDNISEGFYVNKICLGCIANAGLNQVNATLTKMSQESFEECPSWLGLLEATTETCRLYVPKVYNFQDVDGVILALNRADRVAHLYAIQITIAKHHITSDRWLYDSKWRSWIASLEKHGYSTRSTFIWIESDKAAARILDDVPPLVRTTRHCVTAIRPGYSLRQLRIKDIDLALARFLK
jgi:hypothetical protein